MAGALHSRWETGGYHGSGFGRPRWRDHWLRLKRRRLDVLKGGGAQRRRFFCGHGLEACQGATCTVGVRYAACSSPAGLGFRRLCRWQSRRGFHGTTRRVQRGGAAAGALRWCCIISVRPAFRRYDVLWCHACQTTAVRASEGTEPHWEEHLHTSNAALKWQGVQVACKLSCDKCVKCVRGECAR